MKKFLKIFFFLCALCFIYLPIIFPQTKEIKLTMQEAVEMAHKHRPSLNAFKYATQASKQDEKKAMAGYLPQVTLTEQQSFQDGLKGPQNSISVQASQLVYSFAGPLEERRIAQKVTESSKYYEETHKDLVQNQVEAAFLQSWLLQRKNKFIEFLSKSSTENIKKSEHQNELDLLDKNVWMTDAATHSEKMSTVYLYTDELYNAKNQLEYLIGKPFQNDETSITLKWDSKKEITLKPLHYYYDQAIKNRKEIKQKQMEIEQQQEYQSYYRKKYLPTVNITGQSGRSSGIGNNSIGAALSWNVFDGGANYHVQNKANANKLKAMMEKESYVQQAKYDVQKAYYDLSSYLKQLVAKNIKLAQAKNEFILKKQQFEIGDISKVDLETAKYNWETQKFNWLSLKITAAVKERELYYACGYPESFN